MAFPPNLTKIVIPTEIPLSDAHEGQAVSRLSTPTDYFSWRDVVQVVPETAQNYQAQVCQYTSNPTQMTIRYNRGNGKYYSCLYRAATPNGQPTNQRVSQQVYHMNNTSRMNNILGAVLNQGQCGSCYAFGTTECVTNRMILSTFSQTKVQLSPWFIANKCTQVTSSDVPANTNQYCGGGEIAGTLRNIEGSTGVASYQDYPYPNITSCSSNTSCNNVQLGPQNCMNNPNTLLYKSYRAHWECTKTVANAMQANNFNSKTLPGTIVPATPQDPMGVNYWLFNTTTPDWTDNMGKIMAHLYNEGPAVLGFTVYTDFSNFNSTNPYAIYKPTSGSKQIDGGHAVLLVGYGTAPDGTLYWEIQNSWGTGWGDVGFFYMIRGINYCGVECNAMGNLVDSNPLIDPPLEPYPTPVAICSSGSSGSSSLLSSSSNMTMLSNPVPQKIIPIPHPEPFLPEDRIVTVSNAKNNSSSTTTWLVVGVILAIVVFLFIAMLAVAYTKSTPKKIYF